ncbi:MAG: VWA domain-containing protein [Candidatus Acidiferrales bacterium]
MNRTIAALGLSALVGISAPALAQQSTRQPAPPQGQTAQRLPPPIVSRTQSVIVPVTVKDGQGQLVAGLQKDDFEIFADDVQQHIDNFSADPMPLSAVVLIDNDLPDRAASQVQKSLVSISAGFGSMDEVALVTYDKFPTTVAGFSFSNDKLFTQLQRLEIGSHSNMVIADPTTAGPMVDGRQLPTASGPPQHGSQRYVEHDALEDALYSAAQMLESRGRDRRKIVFLISDGADSKNSHTVDETMHYLLSNDISVYSISVTHSMPIGRSLVQRGLSNLGKYAFQTGGDTFFAGKQRDLERLYSELTEEARNQYTLTFSPHNVSIAKDYHSIEVRVLRPELNVTSRQFYYDSELIPPQ